MIGRGVVDLAETITIDPMQLLDEMSMIIVTLIMCYGSFSHSQPPLASFFIAFVCTSTGMFIALYYHYLKDPVFHQNAYAFLTVIVLFRSIFIMQARLKPALLAREKKSGLELMVNGRANGSINENQSRREEIVSDGQGTEGVWSQESTAKVISIAARASSRRLDNARDQHIIRTMWLMIAFGLSVFLGGFAVWNLDNIYCGTLRGWRREMGLPWGIMLEGHGWW